MSYVPSASDFQPSVAALLWALITCVIGFCALITWPFAVILKRDGPISAVCVAAAYAFTISFWMAQQFSGDYSGASPPKSAAFLSALTHAAVGGLTGVIIWLTAYVGVESEDN